MVCQCTILMTYLKCSYQNVLVFSLELTITSALFCLHPPLTSITMEVEFYENIHVFLMYILKAICMRKKINYNILALFYLFNIIHCLYIQLTNSERFYFPLLVCISKEKRLLVNVHCV